GLDSSRLRSRILHAGGRDRRGLQMHRLLRAGRRPRRVVERPRPWRSLAGGHPDGLGERRDLSTAPRTALRPASLSAVTRMLVAGGMVAREVLAAASTLGWEVTARNHAELDITDAKSVRTCLIATTPDLVLNAAAMAQVDVAESEPDVARRVNAEGPGWLADATSTCAMA